MIIVFIMYSSSFWCGWQLIHSNIKLVFFTWFQCGLGWIQVLGDDGLMLRIRRSWSLHVFVVPFAMLLAWGHASAAFCWWFLWVNLLHFWLLIVLSYQLGLEGAFCQFFVTLLFSHLFNFLLCSLCSQEPHVIPVLLDLQKFLFASTLAPSLRTGFFRIKGGSCLIGGFLKWITRFEILFC